jgi:hypothetical protein
MEIGDHPDLVAGLGPLVAPGGGVEATNEPEEGSAGAPDAGTTDPWSPESRNFARRELIDRAEEPTEEGPPIAVDWSPFEVLLQQTWDWDEEWRFSTQVDEVFLGALITGTLNNDYSLMEISSDGSHHHLRFEHIDTGSRLVYRVSYLTDTLPVAKVLGHRVSVVFGYGENLPNPVRDLALDGASRFGLEDMPSPGTLVIAADEGSDYSYAKVELTLNISTYVNKDYSVDTMVLGQDVRTTIGALKAYLCQRAN